MTKKDFYSGFEGEPRVNFLFGFIPVQEIAIWDGYFDKLMDLDHPNDNGDWKGLALYYHTDTGWYDEESWRIPDVSEVIVEFERLDMSKCKEKILTDLRTIILDLLKKAERENVPVFLSYE